MTRTSKEIQNLCINPRSCCVLSGQSQRSALTTSGWPAWDQPGPFVYVPGKVRSVSQAWHRCVLADRAEKKKKTNKKKKKHAVLMSLFYIRRRLGIFSSPKNSLLVSVFVMGLMWCRWQCLTSSIQQQISFNCSHVPE